MKIFAGGLPYNLSETELRDFFEVYGKVSSIKLIIDKNTHKGKGFGFIEMPNENEAKRAIEELNGAEVDGRQIEVNKSEERKDENKRSNFSTASKKSDHSRGGYNKGTASVGNNNSGNRKNSSRRASY
jgi:RNA recognition motif-containing protein